MQATYSALVIAGTKPTGDCAPNGRTRWATRRYDDGRFYFTEHNGWLIAAETSTDDPALADAITDILKNRIDS